MTKAVHPSTAADNVHFYTRESAQIAVAVTVGTDCIKNLNQVRLGILHELEDAHKILHLIPQFERRVSQDQLFPNHSVLEDPSDLFLRLGQAQRRLKVQVLQKLCNHLRKHPELVLVFLLNLGAQLVIQRYQGGQQKE